MLRRLTGSLCLLLVLVACKDQATVPIFDTAVVIVTLTTDRTPANAAALRYQCHLDVNLWSRPLNGERVRVSGTVHAIPADTVSLELVVNAAGLYDGEFHVVVRDRDVWYSETRFTTIVAPDTLYIRCPI